MLHVTNPARLATLNKGNANCGVIVASQQRRTQPLAILMYLLCPPNPHYSMDGLQPGISEAHFSLQASPISSWGPGIPPEQETERGEMTRPGPHGRGPSHASMQMPRHSRLAGCSSPANVASLCSCAHCSQVSGVSVQSLAVWLCKRAELPLPHMHYHSSWHCVGNRSMKSYGLLLVSLRFWSGFQPNRSRVLLPAMLSMPCR